MTDSESLGDVIARMQRHYPDRRPHAVSSPAFRSMTRKPTDTGTGRANADTSNPSYPNVGANTNANRKRGARFGTYYRPRAADLAGEIPNARATAPRVKPATRTRIPAVTSRTVMVTDADRMRDSQDRASVASAVESARAVSTWAAPARAWVSTRYNLALAAGDDLAAGEWFPSEISAAGNPGPAATYGTGRRVENTRLIDRS